MMLTKNDRREKEADARRFGRRIDDRWRRYIYALPVDRLTVISPAVPVIIAVTVMPSSSTFVTVAVMTAPSALVTVATVTTVIAE